jgi:putative oxidoreductase
MLKRFFSYEPLWQETGLTVIRVLVGGFMVYHGLDVFDQKIMADNAKWLSDMKFPLPGLLAYLGKGSEWAGGILFTIGLFTRLALIPVVATMLIIAFGMGHGKIWMDDQHPFLFALLFLVTFFTGPGKWSLDYYFFGRKEKLPRV